MTWLAVRLALRKAWAWCKKNWKFIIGFSVPILFWVLTRRSFNNQEIIGRIQEDYEKEINVIEESHKIEKEKRDLANEKYTTTIKEIEEKFSEREESLSIAKKRKIKKVIEENIENPDEITRRLAEITGFEIHNNG